MKKPTARMSISRKIFLIASSFALPIVVLMYLMVVNINSNIDFAAQEIRGNAYQRPLEGLLRLIQENQLDTLGGSDVSAEQLKAVRDRIEAGFQQLIEVDRHIGPALQFTDEGLAKRKREHLQVKTVHGEWQKLAAALSNSDVSRASLDEKYDHLASDLRMMITHAGDTSNLILDPDLDSYYLMDVTLLALPQTQDRLARVAKYGYDILVRGNPTDEERVQLAVHAALLQEADLDRIIASTETSLNEDANFYDVSPTLGRNLKPALTKYQDATKKFIELTRQAASSNGSSLVPASFLAAAREAREASFAYWNAAVVEMDKLLQLRIESFEGRRTWSVSLAFLAILAASLMAYFLMRTIANPLVGLVKSLAPGADMLGVCVERISETSRNKSDDPQETEIICQELDAHCSDMRTAVAELVAQVHGSRSAQSANGAIG